MTSISLNPRQLLAVAILFVSGLPAIAQPTLPRVGLAAEALLTFQVRLTWQSPSPSEPEFEIVRLRVDGTEPLRVLPVPWLGGVPGYGPADGRDQSYVDTEVLPLTAYRYEVRPPGAASGTWEATDVETSGNEVVVKGRKTLAEVDLTSRPVHRLVLSAGATLITSGRDLVLNLIELRAEDATILTFPVGAQAQPGQSGRDGGTIRLTAQRATGTKLTVIGRGEKGGKGSDGTQGAQGLAGAAGHNATGTANVGTGFPPTIRQICTRPAGNGQPGTDGAPGGRGGQGSPGGNSARVEIRIQQNSPFIADLDIQPGLGGDGGDGGSGGRGGPGGSGGLPHPFCPAGGATGVPGRDGLRGPPGATGSNGMRLPDCLVIGSNRRGSC